MRIVAGTHRGRRLEVPEGLDTRPTTDRVREAIMSSLYSLLGSFDSINVLDAFSGTGAMGLESLSRGAAHATLNDIAPASRACISENVRNLHYEEPDVRISSVDILRLGLPGDNAPYNLVFLDPPYAVEEKDIALILDKAYEEGLFAPDCIIVYEHDKTTDSALFAAHFEIIKEKQYGKTYTTYLCVK